MSKTQDFQYTPGKWEKRVDRVVGFFSPRRAMQRELDRYRYSMFRHQAAQSNPGRRNTALGSIYGETAQGNRERLQLQWNSLDLIENSGLAEGIRKKFVQYVCGSLRFQMRTGNKQINSLYESYFKDVSGKGLDLSGRNSLRRLAGLAVSGTLVKGDAGVNIVGRDVRLGAKRKRVVNLQGIEADRIGDPYAYMANRNYVGGVHLTDYNEPTAYDIFYRDPGNSLYKFDQTIPRRDESGLPRFLHTMNPLNFDEVRGRTAFRVAIDQISYLNDMRKWELMAMLWAGSRAGVYHTNTGELPADLPFNQNASELPTDRFGNRLDQVKINPNTLTALGVGENITMFASDRPSPNVIAMYCHVIREIAGSLGLSYANVFDMSGTTGPAVRSVNKQDDRTYKLWQMNLGEDILDPVAFVLIGTGIENGDIPYHPDWTNWAYGFPASISIDSGRDAVEDIALMEAGLQSGQNIAQENADDLEEIQGQRSREVLNLIELAVETAKAASEITGTPVQWQDVYTFMIPKGSGGKSTAEGLALSKKALAEAVSTATDAKDAEKAGATTEGVAVD